MTETGVAGEFVITVGAVRAANRQDRLETRHKGLLEVVAALHDQVRTGFQFAARAKFDFLLAIAGRLLGRIELLN